MRKLLWAIAIASIGFGVAACREPEAGDNDSEVLWGHFKDDNPAYGKSNWLVNVRPQDEVEMCGDKQETTIKFIRRWAEAAGRGKYIKVRACGKTKGSGKTYKVTVKTQVVPKSSSPNQQDPCSINGVQGYTNVPTGEVFVCKKLAAPEDFVILHELGHMWGLCDQYPGGEAHCHPSHKSPNMATTSVMGQGTDALWASQQLSADDREGIVAFTKRSDFAAVTKAWEDYLKTNPTPEDSTAGGSDSSGGGGGSTPDPSGGGNNSAIDAIYIGLPEPDSSGNFHVYVSTATNVDFVAICRGDQTACLKNGPPLVPVQFALEASQPNPSRKIFKSTVAIPAASITAGSEAFTLFGLNATGNPLQYKTVKVEAQ